MQRRILSLLVMTLLPLLSQAATKPNIVLITLDSTRSDRVGLLGSKNHLTPAIDTIGAQSLVFEHAYSQTPLTVVSHATILSGTYPQSHHVNEFGSPLATSTPYLPDLLHAQGYRTGAFVGSILLDPKNGLAPGFNRGFDVYDAGFHPTQHGESRYQSVERRGTQVVAHANTWVTHNSKNPFFLWVHLNDAHAPYAPSYDRGVASADSAVSVLIAALRANKLYDDALIVLTADHGESLGAHNEDSHGIFLYDETIHVPLLVKLPQNQMAGKRVPGKVRLVDVAPTILEVAGVAGPVADAGPVFVADCQDQSHCRPARLLAQRFSTACFRLERSGIMAHGKVSLYSRTQAGIV